MTLDKSNWQRLKLGADASQQISRPATGSVANAKTTPGQFYRKAPLPELPAVDSERGMTLQSPQIRCLGQQEAQLETHQRVIRNLCGLALVDRILTILAALLDPGKLPDQALAGHVA